LEQKFSWGWSSTEKGVHQSHPTMRQQEQREVVGEIDDVVVVIMTNQPEG